MKPTRTKNFARHRHYGISIIEILLALGIAAMMLTALVAAVQAMSSSVKINESYIRSSNAARAFTSVLSAKARTAHALEIQSAGGGSAAVVGNELQGTRLVIHEPAPGIDATCTTTFEFANGQVSLTQVNVDEMGVSKTQQAVALRNVSNLLFRSIPETDLEGNSVLRFLSIDLKLTNPEWGNTLPPIAFSSSTRDRTVAIQAPTTAPAN